MPCQWMVWPHTMTFLISEMQVLPMHHSYTVPASLTSKNAHMHLCLDCMKRNSVQWRKRVSMLHKPHITHTTSIRTNANSVLPRTL